jgi:hypothetical protein
MQHKQDRRQADLDVLHALDAVLHNIYKIQYYICAVQAGLCLGERVAAERRTMGVWRCLGRLQ